MDEHPTPLARDDTDAKAWFYLDHRGDIETWAALRGEAAAFVDRHLVALLDQFETFADAQQATIDTADLEGGPQPRIGLVGSSWPRDDLTGSPAVSVVLQWERAKLLRPGGNEWPWIGVWTSDLLDEPHKAALEDHLEPARRSLDGKRYGRWPLWRYVSDPTSDGALNPTALLSEATTGFTRLWRTVAPILDALYRNAAGRDPASHH